MTDRRHRARPDRTPMFVLLVVSLMLTTASAEAYTVVLKDDKRIEVTAKPSWAFGRAPVVLTDGRRLTLLHAGVDHAATERANPTQAQEDEAPQRVWTNKDLERLPDSLDTTMESSSRERLSPLRTAPSNRPRTATASRGGMPATSPATAPSTDSATVTANRRRDLRNLPNNELNSVARSENARDRTPTPGGTTRSEAARQTQANLARSRAALQSQRTNARRAGAATTENIRKKRYGR